MKIDGTYHIEADPRLVWEGLMSPDLLARCVPGCQQLEQTGDRAYAVRLKAGIGAVSGIYTGTVRIYDIDEPRSFRMSGEGKRAGSSASGTGLITFAPENGGTRLDVEGEARVTGIIARVGQRLIGSAARVLMDQFFNSAKSALESEDRPRGCS